MLAQSVGYLRQVYRVDPNGLAPNARPMSVASAQRLKKRGDKHEVPETLPVHYTAGGNKNQAVLFLFWCAGKGDKLKHCHTPYSWWQHETMLCGTIISLRNLLFAFWSAG
jgi:hypothetical protein